jgi:S-formylglutathione hydrolase FrmB
MMARMPEMSRRAVLRLGTGAAAGALGAYAVDRLLPGRPPVGTPVVMTGTGLPLAPPPPLDTPPAPTMVTGSFVSAARGGVATNWAIARPPGQTKPLHPVIALHGKGSSAATVMEGGVEQGLAQAVAAGLPPFAVVAVDGGGSYWHKRTSGEDSGAMVLNELIPMLAGQGLDTSRVGFLGWSMGGYGALYLSSVLGAGQVAVTVAESPAIWHHASQSASGAFDDAADFDAHSIFSHLGELDGIPLRVDCGASDGFAPVTRDLRAALHPTPAGGIEPGGHDDDYWRSQARSQLEFVGRHLPA